MKGICFLWWGWVGGGGGGGGGEHVCLQAELS